MTEETKNNRRQNRKWTGKRNVQLDSRDPKTGDGPVPSDHHGQWTISINQQIAL